MTTSTSSSHSLSQEDVLSPRRSPVHVARVKRSHQFNTPFRSVKIEVASGGDFVHPRGQLIKEPLIHVIIGRSAYTMKPPSGAAGGKFTFNCTDIFPYYGEPRVRLLVTDGPSHIGFYDINMTTADEKGWSKKVTLYGRKGISGWLQVNSRPSGKEVRPGPPTTELPQLREHSSTGSSPDSGSTTPPHPSESKGEAGKHRSSASSNSLDRSYSSSSSSSSKSKDKSSVQQVAKETQSKPKSLSSADEAPPAPKPVKPKVSSSSSSESTSSGSSIDLTPSAEPSSFGSVHISVLRVENLEHPKSGELAEKPYVIAKLGKHKLRSQNGAMDGSLGDKLVFPYQQMRNLHISVYEDKKMARDPKLGSTVVDLDNYLHRGPVKVTLPLEYKKVSQGVLHSLIEFITKEEPSARIVSPDVNTSHINAYSATESSSATSEATSAGMNKLASQDLKAKSVRVRVLGASGLSSGTSKADAEIKAYVKGRVGSKWLKTKSNKAGANPTFNEQMVFPYDQQRNIKLVVQNDLKARRDPVIGSAKIDLEPLVNTLVNNPRVVELDIVDGKGKKTGKLKTSVELCTTPVKKAFVETYTYATAREEFEASTPTSLGLNAANKSLICTPLSGSDLPRARKMDTLDPYVVLRYGDNELVGPVAEDAGANPKFHSTFHFPGGSHKELRVAVYDRAHMIKDSLVGYAVIDLSKTVPPSVTEAKTLSLKLKDSKGQPAGKLDLKLEWKDKSIPLGVWTDETAFQETTETQVFTPREGTPSHVTGHSVKSFRLRAEAGENISAALKHPVYVKVGHADLDVKGNFVDAKSTSPIFNDEFVVPYGGARFAKIGVYQSSHVSKNAFIGEGSIDLDQFLAKPGTTESLLVHITDKKDKPAGTLKVHLTPSTQTETHARVLKFVDGKIEPPQSVLGGSKWSAVIIDVKKGVKLVDPKGDESDLLDPFIVMKYGDDRLRGKTHKNAGVNPTFVDTFCFPYQSRTKLNIEVFDHESLARDVCIGTASLDLNDLASKGSSAPKEEVIDIKLNNQITGTLLCDVRLSKTEVFKKPVLKKRDVTEEVSIESDDDVELLTKSQGPAVFNSFTLQLLEGQDLRHTNKLDKLDPYVIATYGDSKLKTKEYHNAGNNPKFDQGFVFPKKDYRHVKLEVYNKNSLFKDTFVGSATLDLDAYNTVLQNDRQLSIKLHDKRGKDVGILKCLLTTSSQKASSAQVVTRPSGGARALKVGSQEPISATSTRSFEKTGTQGSAENMNTLNRLGDADKFKSADVEVVKLSGLKNTKPKIDTIDPYVVMKLGDDELKGTTQKDAGPNCAVGDVFHFPYKGSSNLRLEVFDKAHLAKDPLLGAAKINLDNFSGTNHKLKIPLLTKDGEPDAGFAFVKLSLNQTLGEAKPMVTPAPKKMAMSSVEKMSEKPKSSETLDIDASSSSHGETPSAYPNSGIKSVRVQLIHCQGLTVTDGKDLNPYVLGRLGRKTLRSETVKKSEGDAAWDEDFVFPYTGTRKLKLLVRNNISMGRDKTVGYAKIDLDQFLMSTRLHSYTCALFNPETDEPNGELAVRILPSKSSVEKAVVEDRGDVASSASSLEKQLPAAVYHAKSVHLDRLILTEINAPGENFDTINPYLEIRYGKKHLRSSTCKGYTKIAEYYERHSFSTTSSSLVRVKVMNNQKFALDRQIGKGSINIANFAKEGHASTPFKITLVDDEGRKTGVLEGGIIFDDVEVKKGAATTKRSAPKVVASKGNAAKVKGPVAEVKRKVNKEGPPSVSSSDAESLNSSAFSADLKVATTIMTTAKSFILEVIGGESLAKTRKNDILQPFVQLNYGKDKLKTRTVVNGGANPLFGDKCIFPYSNKRYVMVTLKDNVKRARDVVVGRAKLDLEEHINKPDPNIVELIMKDDAGKACGLLKLRFIPSQSTVHKAEVESTVPKSRKVKNRSVDTASTRGETPSSVVSCPYKTVEIATVCASSLKNPKATVDTLDPYVVVRFGSNELKGKAMKDGGDDPDFHDLFQFPYVARRSIRFQVFDKAHMTKDPLLGSAKVNLDTFIASQSPNNRLKLQLYDSKGNHAGYLNVKLNLLKTAVPKATVAYTETKAVAAKSIEVELKDVTEYTALTKPSASVYTRVSIGKDKLNTSLVKAQGSNFNIQQKMLFPRSGKIMAFEVREVDNRDQRLGAGFVDVGTFLDSSENQKSYKVHIQDEDGKKLGYLTVLLKKNAEKCKKPAMLSSHTPYEQKKSLKSSDSSSDSDSSASTDESDEEAKLDFDTPWKGLHVTIEKGQDLRNTQIFGGRMDPYLVTRVGTTELKSDPLMNAGSNAEFMTTFSFAYDGAALLRLFVYDYEQWRSDSLSGYARVDMAPYAKYEGAAEKTMRIEIPLLKKGKKKASAGTLKGKIRFTKDPVTIPSVVKVSLGGKQVTSSDD